MTRGAIRIQPQMSEAGNGLTLPLMSKFLYCENNALECDRGKQNCELGHLSIQLKD
jgi:hypothetical protein